ncbi:MAG: MFS transporter [Terrimicrobiaceae bacterium]
MSSRPIQYATIFLTVFIDILGFGIVIPVLPLYAEHFGATALQIGVLVGVFSLMQFLFAPLWGKLSDRIGRKPVLLIGMVGTVAGYVTMGLAGSVFFLMLARVIAGVSGANIGVAQAYLADISSPENRAKAMGLLGAAFGLGFVFGPALGGWASGRFHYSTPMFIAAGLAAINLVFVFFFLPESRTGQSPVGRTRIFPELFQHVKKSQFVWSVAAYFAVIAGFSMLTTLFALYLLKRFGLGVQATGFLLAGIGVLGVLIQGGLIGRLTKKFGEPRLALVGTFFMGGGLLGLGWAQNLGLVYVAAGAVGIGNSLLMPTLSALASRSAEAAWQGRALGVMQSSGSLARFLGPLAAGLLLSIQGNAGNYAALPLFVAAAIVLVAAGLVYRLNGVMRAVAA